MQKQSGSQEQILKKLADDFLAFQQSKEGKKIIYSPELRKKVEIAIDSGVTPLAVASACHISLAAVRNWTRAKARAAKVKRLHVEPQEVTPEFIVIHINDRVRMQLPVTSLNSALLREIFALGFL